TEYPHGHPYLVTEQNFAVELLQHRGRNRHAVVRTHPRESLDAHYERNPSDPRVTHALTLAVDEYGNVLRSVRIAYPRNAVPQRQREQTATHVVVTLNTFANIDDRAGWRRIGVPVETRRYEVVRPPSTALRFSWADVRDLVNALVPAGSDESPPEK